MSGVTSKRLTPNFIASLAGSGYTVSLNPPASTEITVVVRITFVPDSDLAETSAYTVG